MDAKETSTSHVHEVGKTVMVYEDCWTKETPEGKAVIIKQCTTPDYYQVQFLDEDTNKYYRFIY